MKNEKYAQHHLTVFNELKDQLKECSRYLLHFLTSLEQNKNYAQRVVSWFSKLKTKESMLKMVLSMGVLSTQMALLHSSVDIPYVGSMVHKRIFYD